MSLFNYTFSGLQIQSFDPVAIQYSTSNAGQLRSRGGDLELRWKAPTDGLTLSAAVAYTDAEFTETFISNAGIDLKGRAAPRAPKWSGNRSEEHTSELQSLMRISYAVFCLKKKKNNNQ